MTSGVAEWRYGTGRPGEGTQVDLTDCHLSTYNEGMEKMRATEERHRRFCSNLTAARKRLGLTQAQAAERLGISQPRYAEIENGRGSPRLDLMCRLADGLETTVEDLCAVSEPVAA